MRKRSIVAAAFLSLTCGLGIWAAYSFGRFNQIQRDFTKVQAGQSSASVIAALGKPNYHSGACLQDLTNTPKCSKQLVYSHPFAPLVPEYYVVSLTSDD